MRIAVSGAHVTGKSTLVAELSARLPKYEIIEETYHALNDSGYVFAATPSVDDFELLLEHSVTTLCRLAGDDYLLDRSPVDYLAYLAVIARDAGERMPRWISLVRDAMCHVDLVVFVPIEQTDRITSVAEYGGLRKKVHRVLHEILLDDAWGFSLPAIQVTGSVSERADEVMRRLHETKTPRYPADDSFT